MNSTTSTATLSPATAEKPAGTQPATGRTAFSVAKPVLLGALALAALGWTVRTGLHAYRYEKTDDAYVTGHLFDVSAQVDGQVKEVLVEDNQTVRAGDVLFRLDPLEFEIALEKATATVTQAQAMEKQTAAAATQADAAIDEAHARVAQGEAQVAQSEAQLALARLTLSRSEELKAHGSVVPQSEVDAARSAAQVAESVSQAARANLTAARTSIRSAESAQVAARAQVAAASAAVATADAARRDAERKLALTTIKAPADGRIGNRHLEPGNHIQAGQAVLALAGADVWIVANFKETQLARMTPGQEVDLEIDAVPDHALHGKIASVAPASGAKYALLPPDNATGNFNKVVQRVPVKILLDATTRQQLGDKLRLGLSAVVNVRVR